MAETLQQIPIEKLAPSPFNPRKAFAKAELAELADSIRAQGVIEPLLVREISTNGHWHFEIVAGERRWRAAQLAEIKMLPAIVRELTDVAARELQIIENLQRADIGPLEEAAAYQGLLKAAGDAKQPLTVKELAARLGKSERYVYSRLELLKTDPEVQQAVAKGTISAGHAQELVPLVWGRQVEMLEWLLSGDPCSVAELREEIKYRYAPKPTAPQRAAEAKRRAASDARWKAQQARDERKRKLDELAEDRVERAVWPKLKALPAAKLTEALVAAVLDDGWRGRHARKIAGKNAPRLPFAAFVEFFGAFRYFGKPNWAWALAKACGIDPAQVRRAVEAEQQCKYFIHKTSIGKFWYVYVDNGTPHPNPIGHFPTRAAALKDAKKQAAAKDENGGIVLAKPPAYCTFVGALPTSAKSGSAEKAANIRKGRKGAKRGKAAKKRKA